MVETNEMTSHIIKDFSALLKQESITTHGLNQILEGVEYTAEQIRDVDAYLGAFTTNSMVTKEHADKVYEKLNKSSEEIGIAKQSLMAVVERMGSFSAVFKALDDKFVELEKQYDEISNFASVITDIAKQTNLLSLNASIESARAGETGKGFAVVANEIKKLSDETHRNANDIISALNRMTGTIKTLGEQSHANSSVVDEVTEMLKETDTLFDNIYSSEEGIHDQMQEVQKSQEGNIEQVNEINTALKKVISKANSENEQLSKLIESVQIKADYYLTILNQLNQIKDVYTK